MRTIVRLLAMSACVLAATPALAQGSGPNPGDRMDVQVNEKLRDAHDARVAGNCLASAIALNEAERLIESYRARPFDYGDDRRISRWRSAIRNGREQTCETATPEDATMADLPASGPLGPALPPTQPAHAPVTTVQLGLGYGVSTLPRVNYGFISDGTPGSERAAGFSERRPPTFNFTGAAGHSGLGILLLGYRTGDARNHTVVAPGTGTAQGVVGTDNAPSTSTGVAANLGVTVDTFAALDEISGRARFGLYSFGNDRDDEEAWVRGQMAPSVYGTAGNSFSPIRVPRRESHLSGRITGELFGLYRDSDYLGTASIVGTTGAGTPVSVVQNLDQEVRQVEVGANLGVEVTVPLSPGIRFTTGAQAGAYYYDYGGTSIESRVQNVGPASDRAYTVTIEDHKSGIAYHGDAIAELTFDLGRSLEMFVGGAVNYDSVRGQWVNPSSGDFVLAGGTSFLDTDHAFDWQIGIGLRVALGRDGSR